MSTEMNVDDIKKFLEEDKSKRAAEFGAYLQRGVEIYRCKLVAIPTISPDGRIGCEIKVVPLD